MKDSAPHPEDELASPSREEMLAALFANMVIQQTNMAMMLLGKVAHPETGKIIRDIEAARMFIDQLEMIEVKTKGNLSKEEDGLIKQALAALHMAFVEAVDGDAKSTDDITNQIIGSKEAPKPAAPAAEKPVSAPAEAPAATAAASDESRKKFSKKY